MIELYGVVSPNVQKIALMLEETAPRLSGAP